MYYKTWGQLFASCGVIKSIKMNFNKWNNKTILKEESFFQGIDVQKDFEETHSNSATFTALKVIESK